MPKCNVCSNLFHPDWVLLVDDNIYKCVFCETDKKELVVEDTDGKPAYKVTKEQAIKDYDVYIKKIMEKEQVQNIIKGVKPDGKV